MYDLNYEMVQFNY